MRAGKAQVVTAQVVTTTGQKNMGDIKVGDIVHSPTGQTANVIQVHPQGIQPLYRITLNDGASTVVTEDHLWLAKEGSPFWSPKICTTGQLRVILDTLVPYPNGQVPLLPARRLGNDMKWIGIKSILPDRSGEAQCITLDSPDGLYITDNGIVTHNSIFLCGESIQLSLDFPGNRGYIARHENVVFHKTTGLTLAQLMPEQAVADHNRQYQYYEFHNGSRLYYGGLKPSQSDKPLDKLKSLELGFFAIDEASETTRELFLLLQTRLCRPSIPYKAQRGILASNPEPGWVKEDFLDSPIPNSRFIPALPSDNPYNPEGYVEGLRSSLAGTIGWVERYIDGDWNAPMEMAGERQVFTWSMIRGAVERDTEIKDPCEMGIDVARGGNDKTIIYVRRGPKVMLLTDAHIANTMAVAEEAAAMIRQYNPTTVRVDATGIGAGVADRLSQLFDGTETDIVHFVAGSRAVDSERFFNARSEACWMLRDRFEQSDIDIPDDSELKGQLSSIRYKIRSDKRVMVETKDEMARRGMKSPDKLDALALTFGGGSLPELDIYVG